jgi:3-oxoacyl-[acyl-carrier protein] reductase
MKLPAHSEPPLTENETLLLIGGTGAIGSAVGDYFKNQGWRVIVVTRQHAGSSEQISWDPSTSSGANAVDAIETLKSHGPFEAVCWAQGINFSDSLYDFDANSHIHLYQANVLCVLNSLNVLLSHDLLQKPARLCVISSIWQNMARQNKLSYCISKAALEGLVLSAATDLARDGHLINAVLPGVIDTPMTRLNLTVDQILKIESSTLFNRLPRLQDVASCVFNLCRRETTGITGQFINVDLGYSCVRII